jgi:uncharacterized SAM-binding protein YcdF (DUF218 family)
VSAQAVVVLGSHSNRTCRRLVAAAERLAARAQPELVVFSGWLGEAERMRSLWRGPPGIAVLLEQTAATTAENAARTLPLLLERGVTRGTVVCAPTHLPRARWIFRRVYEHHGVAVSFSVARIAPTPGALLWELGAFGVASQQARAARSELERR